MGRPKSSSSGVSTAMVLSVRLGSARPAVLPFVFVGSALSLSLLFGGDGGGAAAAVVDVVDVLDVAVAVAVAVVVVDVVCVSVGSGATTADVTGSAAIVKAPSRVSTTACGRMNRNSGAVSFRCEDGGVGTWGFLPDPSLQFGGSWPLGSGLVRDSRELVIVVAGAGSKTAGLLELL